MTSENDIQILQQDFTELEKWSATWLLKFNTSKCKVIIVGHKGETRYFLHDPINNRLEQLKHINLEKDIGDWINKDMKWSENCEKAIKKMISVLGMIKRNFNVIDCHTFKILSELLFV